MTTEIEKLDGIANQVDELYLELTPEEKISELMLIIANEMAEHGYEAFEIQETESQSAVIIQFVDRQIGTVVH